VATRENASGSASSDRDLGRGVNPPADARFDAEVGRDYRARHHSRGDHDAPGNHGAHDRGARADSADRAGAGRGRALHAIVIALVIAGDGTSHARPAPPQTAQRLGKAFEAYRRGDLAAAKQQLAAIPDGALVNRDYQLWLRGMIALRTGALGLGERTAAAKAYAKLVAPDGAGGVGDVGTARFRIAEARSGPAAIAAYRAFLLAHPGHPLAARAEQELAARGAPPLTADERIERAKQLQIAHLWDEAVAELETLDPAQLSPDQARQRDYWLGTTLFKMRRRYADAGALLLAVYPKMGGSAAEAMFHGARALSRSDQDPLAIEWYRKVVEKYPKSVWAEEAQFLSGWLEFNRGKYRDAIAPLEESLRRYPKSKWVDDALWFLGLSHFFLGEWQQARGRLEALAKRGGSLEGGKGTYWLARIDEKLGAKPAAIAGYTDAVKRYPFSWYALLARSRLKTLGVTVGPFGVEDARARGAQLTASVDPALATDDLIERADELIAAGLAVDAGQELARGERPFLKRNDDRRGAAFAMLLDRYRKAGNFNRPWMLAIVHNGGALDGPAIDDARRWWENAYPRAYQALIEKHQKLGDNPEGYLYSIMRKESGFNPHDLSYADAQGLLQMIPATTRRVAKTLGIPYDPGRLYEPEYNIQTASWYIGKLLQKFKSQIPIGAGSFNSGPRPVMKWLDLYGDREMDELVELVPFTQTREYMKKVTENFARYRYLYQSEIYEQPLVVDKRYVPDQLTY
jgi:soluble lytic murein transglycosylase